jgi:hypothetical protein
MSAATAPSPAWAEGVFEVLPLSLLLLLPQVLLLLLPPATLLQLAACEGSCSSSNMMNEYGFVVQKFRTCIAGQ